MRRLARYSFLTGLFVAVPFGYGAGVQRPPTEYVSLQTVLKTPANTKQEEIERGRYLVVEVARCPDCHTPRDSEGKPDVSHWLQGAPVWIMPVQSKQRWAAHAPALAHFPYTDQQGQDVLERGIGTNGNPIQPPMHAYHLRHEDAVAIIAYLRSL